MKHITWKADSSCPYRNAESSHLYFHNTPLLSHILSRTNWVHNITIRCLDLYLNFSVICFYIFKVTSFFQAFQTLASTSCLCGVFCKGVHVMWLDCFWCVTLPKQEWYITSDIFRKTICVDTTPCDYTIPLLK